MKASQFTTLLRKLIREEVTSIVREELKAIKPLLMEKTVVAKNQQTPTKLKAAPKRPAPVVSFDGPLADILNETAQSMRNNPAEEWPDLNGGTFTSQNVPQTQNFNFEDEDSAPLSYGSTAPFMKDYSAVMKAADKFSQGNF